LPCPGTSAAAAIRPTDSSCNVLRCSPSYQTVHIATRSTPATLSRPATLTIPSQVQ
ncbi:hypothetical protein FIBSPDRAFT_869090, partial [Athelia psychrophila]